MSLTRVTTANVPGNIEHQQAIQDAESWMTGNVTRRSGQLAPFLIHAELPGMYSTELQHHVMITLISITCRHGHGPQWPTSSCLLSTRAPSIVFVNPYCAQAAEYTPDIFARGAEALSCLSHSKPLGRSYLPGPYSHWRPSHAT